MTSNKAAKLTTDEDARVAPLVRRLTALLVSAVAAGLAYSVIA